MKVGGNVLSDVVVTVPTRKTMIKTFRSFASAQRYIKILRRAGLRWRLTLIKRT